MIKLGLLVTFACVPTIVEVPPNHKWDSVDQKALDKAKVICKRKYGKNTCLEKFRVWKPRQYSYRCKVI